MLLLWVLGAFQGMAQAPLSAILPYTRQGLGLTEGQMSLMLSITRLASLGAVVISYWGDRAGRRRPFLVSYAALMGVSGLTALVPNAAAFVVAQSIVRMATTALATLAVVLLAEQIRASHRAFAIGFYAAAGSLGAGIGQLMLPIAAISNQTWRIPFAVPAVGLLFLPLARRVEESPLIGATRAHVPLKDVLSGDFRRRFWVAGVAGLLAAAFPAVALAFTNERLVADLGYSPAAATAMSLVGGTVGALGFWVGGRLADLWGRRPATILAISTSIVGGIAVFRVHSVAALVASVALGAFGAFAYVPAASAHRAELFPTRIRATSGSASTYLATVGSALGLLIGSFTIDRLGISDTVLLLAVPMALAGVLTLLLPETRGQDLDSVNADR
jgi:MFS family permease